MRLSLPLLYMCLLSSGISGQEDDEDESQPLEAQFTTIPKQEMVNEGGEIRLPCFVEHMADYILVWKFEDTILSVGEKVIEGKSRRRVEKGENGNWLVVSGAREEDEGRYVCMVSAFILKTLEHRVMVRSSPNVEVEGVENNRRVVLEGSDLSTECIVKSGRPLPELTWLDGDGQLVSSGSNLTIPSITRQQGGSYTCRGDNGFSSEGGLATLEVVVEFGPRLGEMQTIHSSKGEPVILECGVEASPEALVTWSKEGEEVSPLHHDISIDGGLNTLTVAPPLIEGEELYDISYTCYASNTHGNASQIFLLTSRPDQPVITSSPNSLSRNSIILEWGVTSSLPLESCHFEVLGPQGFTLNKTLSIVEADISGPSPTWQYKGRYNLGPEWGSGLVEKEQSKARIRCSNPHGEGPASGWFLFQTAGESSGSCSLCGIPVLVMIWWSLNICSYNLL